MLSLFCLFTVIGGKNVYLRLSVSGNCDNKDSVWEILQKEVLYSVVKQFLVWTVIIVISNSFNVTVLSM